MVLRLPPSRSQNPLDDHLGYQLRRASSAVLGKLADSLATVRLTIVEASVLILINSNPAIFQSEIGRKLGIRRANVAPIAASLRQRMLVSTSTRGRLIGFATTPSGRELAVQAERIMRENDDHHFGVLDAASRDQLETLLRELWNERPEGE